MDTRGRYGPMTYLMLFTAFALALAFMAMFLYIEGV
jgi:hypothetical protein